MRIVFRSYWCHVIEYFCILDINQIIFNKMENFSKEELKNEMWKPIFGYDGMYEVSDLGRVRSKKYGYPSTD